MTSRRQFLTHSAGAIAATGIIRADSSKYSTPPNWFERPMRWAQLVFTEDDPGNYDQQFWQGPVIINNILPNIDVNWSLGPPAGGVNTDNFSSIFTGKILGTWISRLRSMTPRLTPNRGRSPK